MDFMELVKTRNSVRSYKPDPVEDEKLKQILEAARLAPSWANMQCWRFIVVTDKEKIKEIARVKGNTWLKKVPVVIVACANPKKSGSRAGLEYYAVDVAIAFEHMVLAATELGLGTCWIGYFDERAVKKLLGIPKNVRVVALTPVGYPTEKESGRDKVTRAVLKSKDRLPMKDIVCYDEW